MFRNNLILIILVLNIGNSICSFNKFNKNNINKENIKEYTIEQFLKAGILPEKYDGAIYDDANIVLVSDSLHQQHQESSKIVDEDDEPKLIDVRIPIAERYIPRSKRYSGFMEQSGYQGSAPVMRVGTGVAPTSVDSTSGLVPYDAHINPDFPQEAPVARGLYNVPEGFNLDKSIDYEFKSGYRRASPGQNPSYSAPATGSFNVAQQAPQNDVTIEGPYVMTANGLAPFNSGSVGSSYNGLSGDTSFGSPSYNGYGSTSGYEGYGNYGGYGNGYGGYGTGYGSNYQGYLQQAASANLGVAPGTSLFG